MSADWQISDTRFDVPVVIAGFNNPLSSTGGLGIVMRGSAHFFSNLSVVCHDTISSGPFQDLRSRHFVYPICLPDRVVQGYQRDFCKTYLWPEFHEDQSSASCEKVFDPEGVYVRQAIGCFSDEFARQVLRVADLAATPPVVWFNDYSMISVAADFGRLSSGRFPVGISIRSSFGVSQAPQFDQFTTKLLVNGISSADFVSVHRERDVYHLLDFVGGVLGADSVDWVNREIIGPHRRTTIRAVQMGNCPAYWKEVGESATTRDGLKKFLSGHSTRQVLLGVSRLEQHKGIETELEVIERLLRYFPSLRRTFTFYRITPIFPEYSMLNQYCQLREKIEKLIVNINAEYGDDSWKPVVFVWGPSLSHEDLAVYYRAADALLVLSNADGYNHVSVEAVLTKQERDRPLSLILSDTGSSDYLSAGYARAELRSPTEMALQLERVLRSKISSRGPNHSALRRSAAARTATDWTREVLGWITSCYARNISGDLLDAESENLLAKGVG